MKKTMIVMAVALFAALPLRADSKMTMTDKDCSTHCDLRELQKQVDALEKAEKTNEASGDKALTREAKKAQLKKETQYYKEKIQKIEDQMGKMDMK